MTADHPSQVMRRAASRLRELAGGATPGPWRVSFIEGAWPVIDGPTPDGQLVAEPFRRSTPDYDPVQRSNAEWIAAMDPAVGVALAGLLEAEADSARRAVHDTLAGGKWCGRCDRGLEPAGPSACLCWDGALATARAILGEAAP